MWAGPASPGVGLPAKTQALLWLRTLAYDHNLHRRAADPLTLLVLRRPLHPASIACAEELLAALRPLSETAVIDGSRFQALALDWSKAEALGAGLEATMAASLYVCPGFEDELPAIAERTRVLSVLSTCGDRACAEGGLGVAFVDRGMRAGLIVNLAAIKAEGVELDSRLLQLAEVLR
jgi:hypothetical protein